MILIDELRSDVDELPWYRWIKRRKLRSDASMVGLAGATLNLNRSNQ